MEFGTWYQINCEGEDQWREDFSRVREAGFDFIVLWNLLPAAGESWERPALQEVSLKYNPDLLTAIARTIQQLKGR